MSLTAILLIWLAVNAGFVAVCLARVARWEAEEYLRRQDRLRRIQRAMQKLERVTLQ